MGNHASAKKRHRQSLKRHARNKHVRSTVRSAVRKARRSSAEGAADASQSCLEAERLLRRAATKGIVHPKTASRTVSRLQKLLKRAG
jgi:small subunit ribosomal protein S20